MILVLSELVVKMAIEGKEIRATRGAELYSAIHLRQ